MTVPDLYSKYDHYLDSFLMFDLKNRMMLLVLSLSLVCLLLKQQQPAGCLSVELKQRKYPAACAL